MYPPVPVFEFLEQVPSYVDACTYFITVFMLAALVSFQRKWMMITILLSELVSCSLDVIRWQPFEYFFIFLFFLYIFYKRSEELFYNGLALMMASIYLYSGLHKFNGGFLHVVWDGMILKQLFGFTTHTIQQFHLHYAGLLLPVLEVAAGIGLFIFKDKRLPIYIMVAAHVFITIMIMFNNYNHVVLPWNMAMVCCLLYLRNNYEFTFNFLYLRRHKIVFAWFVILPLLSLVGLWDKYLSWCVYAGKTISMDICVKGRDDASDLQFHISNGDAYNVCNGAGKISIGQLANTELKLVPYPEEWYYKKLKKKMQQTYPQMRGKYLVYGYPFKDKKEL